MHWLLWGKVFKMLLLVLVFYYYCFCHDLTIPPQADEQYVRSCCETLSLSWFCKNLVRILFLPTLDSTINLGEKSI